MDSGISDNSRETASKAASDPDAFAYFVDPEEVALLVPAWPDCMHLVLCMDSAGLCEFVVFHDDETDTILDRVAEVLDRPVGAFAASPAIEGYPVRSLLFSEENALLKAVQGSESLQEIAADYLINYNFAREEGFDLDAFMRPRGRRDRDLSLRVTTDKIFPVRQKGPGGRRKPRATMPDGYFPAEEVGVGESFYLSLEMWRVGGRIRIAAAAQDPLRLIPTLVRELALRDDFSSFYVPRKELPAQWRPEDGLILDIPCELFPIGFAENCGRRKVSVAVMPHGVFVEFGSPIEVTAEQKPAAVLDPPRDPVPPLRKRLLGNLYLPLLAVAGLGATGLFSTIVAQTAAQQDKPAAIAQAIQP